MCLRPHGPDPGMRPGGASGHSSIWRAENSPFDLVIRPQSQVSSLFLEFGELVGYYYYYVLYTLNFGTTQGNSKSIFCMFLSASPPPGRPLKFPGYSLSPPGYPPRSPCWPCSPCSPWMTSKIPWLVSQIFCRSVLCIVYSSAKPQPFIFYSLLDFALFLGKACDSTLPAPSLLPNLY